MVRVVMVQGGETCGRIPLALGEAPTHPAPPPPLRRANTRITKGYLNPSLAEYNLLTDYVAGEGLSDHASRKT